MDTTFVILLILNLSVVPTWLRVPQQDGRDTVAEHQAKVLCSLQASSEPAHYRLPATRALLHILRLFVLCHDVRQFRGKCHEKGDTPTDERAQPYPQGQVRRHQRVGRWVQVQPEEETGMSIAQDERPLASHALHQRGSHEGGERGKSVQGRQQEASHVGRYRGLEGQQRHQGGRDRGVPETQRRKVPQEDSSRVDRPQAGWRGAHHCNQASHRRGAP